MFTSRASGCTVEGAALAGLDAGLGDEYGEGARAIEVVQHGKKAFFNDFEDDFDDDKV